MGEAAKAVDVQAYTVKDFCAAYGVGRSTVYEEIKAGRLRTVKVGARTLIPVDSARAWFEQLPEGNAA